MFAMTKHTPFYPLIERYYAASRLSQERQQARLQKDPVRFPLIEHMLRSQALHQHACNYAKKSFLSMSAIRLVSYLQPTPGIRTRPLHLPTTPVWIEAEYPVLAPHRAVSGVFFWSAFAFHPSWACFQGKWNLTLIDGQGTGLMTFEYCEMSESWGFSPLHTCPFQSCMALSAKQGYHLFAEVALQPCRKCLEALDHWQSWFATALAAVQGDFAQTIDAQPTSIRTCAVRKEKDPATKQHGEVVVEHVYSWITFDACIKRRSPSRIVTIGEKRDSSQDQVPELDPESILYVTRSIASTERVLDPARCARWKFKRTITVRAHEKRVPMKVDKLQQRFVRVIASCYTCG
jgi:hypothetical protein